MEYYNIEDQNNTDYTESIFRDEKSDDNICDITTPENLSPDADFFTQENINPSKKDKPELGEHYDDKGHVIFCG